MSGHTPGPWEIRREWDFDGPSDDTMVESIGPFEISWHTGLVKCAHEQIEADIALVAAAPDLLEACQYGGPAFGSITLLHNAAGVLEEMGLPGPQQLAAGLREKARLEFAAIAKATGGKP